MRQFAPEIPPSFVVINIEQDIETIYALTNYARNKQGLSDLKVNKLLEESARLKACDMNDRGYFNHEDPTGTKPWIWFDEVGYSYDLAGENLGEDVSDDVQAHKKLMASPTHRDNILNSEYSEIGVARCGRYLVQHFGKPL